MGFGASDVDRNQDFDANFVGTGESVANLSSKQQITHHRGYAYANLNLPEPVTWTAGISYDNYDQDDLKVHKFNPKFGVQWNVTDSLVLRGTVLRVVKPALVNNQTLEPTHVAGFNQLFDDSNAVASWRYGLGLDWSLTDTLFVGGEATWRELSDNLLDFQAKDAKFEDIDEQLHRVYLNWLPISELALSAEFIYDKYSAEKGKDFTDFFGIPTNVVTYSVPFAIRYFHPSGFFAGAGTTYVNQDVNRTNVLGLPEGSSDFFVVDASVGYRLPERFGIVSLSVSNLFDNGFKYLDDSFREFGDAPSVGPYIPERLILGRVTLNF